MNIISSANYSMIDKYEPLWFTTSGAVNNLGAYSRNGINWTETTTLPSTSDWVSVETDRSVFNTYAYGTSSAAYSRNGINWVATTLPANTTWATSTFGDGKFLVISFTAVTAYSTNGGKTWTQGSMPNSRVWIGVAYGGGKFVAVVNNSNIAAHSSDGISWTEVTLPSSGLWQTISYANGNFVIVPSDGSKSLYSTNGGVSWTQISMLQGNWRCNSNGTRIVAVDLAFTNRILYTSNGTSWTSVTLPASATLFGINYGGDKWVATPHSTGGRLQGFYSIDNAVSWTGFNMPNSRNWRLLNYKD
jgi:hypothetical protein